jgi:hypothetical protein
VITPSCLTGSEIGIEFLIDFVSFLAVFNLFAYIIMNNFNAIILFILVGYITYLFSKNMAIVLLVALLITNLFMSSKNNRMGREGMANGVIGDGSGNRFDGSGNHVDGSGNRFDGSGNRFFGNGGNGSSPASGPGPASMTSTTKPKTKPNMVSGMQNMQNIQGLNLDKMQSLLAKSQDLMTDLKSLNINIPGMPNILGNMGQMGK